MECVGRARLRLNGHALDLGGVDAVRVGLLGQREQRGDKRDARVAIRHPGEVVVVRRMTGRPDAQRDPDNVDERASNRLDAPLGQVLVVERGNGISERLLRCSYGL